MGGVFGEGQRTFWRQPANRILQLVQTPTLNSFLRWNSESTNKPENSKKSQRNLTMTVDEFVRISATQIEREEAVSALVSSCCDFTTVDNKKESTVTNFGILLWPDCSMMVMLLLA